MKLILITSDQTIKNEAEIINGFFNAGLEKLHFRKPEWTKVQCAEMLKKIDHKFHKRIMIHQFSEMLEQFELAGYHWTEGERNQLGKKKLMPLVEQYRSRNMEISTAIHDLDNIEEWARIVDYFFFSPVFKSISKSEYEPKYKIEELMHYISANKVENIYALGGVDMDRVPFVDVAGFTGACIFGAVWETDDPVKAFDQIFKPVHA